MKKLTRFFKGEKAFDVFNIYPYIYVHDFLAIDLKTENKIYSLGLIIGFINKELAGKNDSKHLYSKYDVFYSYRSYLPMIFYLFLKIDYFKEGKYFACHIALPKKRRHILFEGHKIFDETINPIVFYFNPFLISLCALLPNFKTDKIILRGYIPEWV
ncbi:MAG: hypothetical protein LWW95_11960 [Candidatus Desulfofervidus auxilii]|nr:hypothetical protein [Candidatus Desulfofervidus auxilii]